MSTSGSGPYYSKVGYKIRTRVDGTTNPPTTTTDPVSYFGYSGGSWARSSISTPNFRRLVQLGKLDLPMNAFVFENERQAWLEGNDFLTLKFSNGQVSMDLTSGMFPEVEFPSIAIPSFTALSLKANSKMLSKLKDQSINVAVALAEGKQSVNTIVNTAKKLAAAGVAARQGNWRLAAQALGEGESLTNRKRLGKHRSLAGNWLELQYGWMPLLSDIYGAAEQLAKYSYVPIRVKQTAVSKADRTEKEEFERYLQHGYTTIDTVQAVKLVVWFTHTGSNIELPAALGLTNPLSVAWELVPYSFVVDWFLPVGNYLNNLDSTLGLVFVKGCETHFAKVTGTRKVVGYTGMDGSTVVERAGTQACVREKVFCQRKVMASFPSNIFPEFKNPLSGLHAANAVALLTQAFTGKRNSALRL